MWFIDYKYRYIIQSSGRFKGWVPGGWIQGMSKASM